MRRILLSTAKIVVSAALLYFALRKANFADLASRIDLASLGWIGLAIAATFLQIFVGEGGGDCGFEAGVFGVGEGDELRGGELFGEGD